MEQSAIFEFLRLELTSVLSTDYQPNLCDCLLEYVPQIEDVHPSVVKATIYLAVKLENKEVFTKLAKRVSNEILEICLGIACDRNSKMMVEECIKAGAFTEENREVPFDTAIEQENLEIVELLIAHGAKVDTDKLNLACMTGNIPIIKKLLEHGALIEPRTFLWGKDVKAVIDFLIEHVRNDPKNKMFEDAKTIDQICSYVGKTKGDEIRKLLDSKKTM